MSEMQLEYKEDGLYAINPDAPEEQARLVVINNRTVLQMTKDNWENSESVLDNRGFYVESIRSVINE